MKIASIDIGTNTVLLLIVRFDHSGIMARLVDEQRTPRLGRGTDSARRLNESSMQRVIDVLREYQSIIARLGADRIVVGGTSAVRDAANRESFAKLVNEETGLELQVLSGNEEARWTYRGAMSGVSDISSAAVIDIGGGSTEIAVGDAQSIIHNISMDIGSVRLAERFFKHDPPTDDEVSAARTWVRSKLSENIDLDFKDRIFVGVAGTATSLAILDQGLPRFDLSAVGGYRLSHQAVKKQMERLAKMNSAEIVHLSKVMEGRNDIITAGTLILCEAMEYCGFEDLIVSERGVRYGMAIREYERCH